MLRLKLVITELIRGLSKWDHPTLSVFIYRISWSKELGFFFVLTTLIKTYMIVLGSSVMLKDIQMRQKKLFCE